VSVFPEKERRIYPRLIARHEVSITANLSLFDVEAGMVGSTSDSLTILGSTYDMSRIGISFRIPLVTVDERICLKADFTLPLLVQLPVGPVRMGVCPVRCSPLDSRDSGAGSLIGAKISRMAYFDRRLLIGYLRDPSLGSVRKANR
jgi:hypothetical protein